MTDSVFSIFPDSQLTSGHDLKGKSARSKKQALCDVKNILQAKRATGNEPLRKFGLQLPSKSDNTCKNSAKQQFTVKETPAKLMPVQDGTFKIACDDKENSSWDKCGGCTQRDEDFIFQMRPLSSQLKSEDVHYMAKGLFSFGVDEPSHIPEDEIVGLPSFDIWQGIEISVPSPSPVILEPILLSCSDDE